MQEVFAALTVAAFVIGLVPYLIDIAKRKTRPERATWLIWSVLGGIAFFSQLAAGAKWSLVLPAVDTLSVFTIFVLALPYGMGGFARRDKIALVIAGAGLVLWYVTNQPLTALLITIGIDGVGAYLTIIKSYESPETETLFSWIMTSLSGLFALLAVGSGRFGLLIYPIYIVLANGAVAAAILAGRKAKTRVYL